MTGEQLRAAAELIAELNARDGLMPDSSVTPGYLREAAKELEQ